MKRMSPRVSLDFHICRQMCVTDGSGENAEISLHFQPGGHAFGSAWQLVREHTLSGEVAQVGAMQPWQSLSLVHLSPKPS